jgi:hypothetical protein
LSHGQIVAAAILTDRIDERHFAKVIMPQSSRLLARGPPDQIARLTVSQ